MDDFDDRFGSIKHQLDAFVWPTSQAFEELTRQQAERAEMLERALGPMRAMQVSLENSGFFRLQDAMRAAAENSGIRKMMENIVEPASAIRTQLKSLQIDMPELFGSRFIDQMQPMLDAFKLSETPNITAERYEPIMPSFDSALFTAPPGEAAQVLSALQAEFDALTEEHQHNPRKAVYMTVTLADGTDLILRTARNIGNCAVDLTGVDIGTGDQRKLEAGIGTLSFEVKVFEVGPRKPNLELIETVPDDDDDE